MSRVECAHSRNSLNIVKKMLAVKASECITTSESYFTGNEEVHGSENVSQGFIYMYTVYIALSWTQSCVNVTFYCFEVTDVRRTDMP